MASPYQTAGTIINRAAVQLGLGVAADPFSSQDPNFVQLCEFINVVGDDLLRAYEWRQLQKEYSFVTVLNQTLYPLPGDFHEMIDQSGWNRSSRLPLGGPLSTQQWQYLKARQVGIVFNVLFRLQPMEIELFNPSVSGQTVAFQYVSTSWVQDAANVNNLDTAGAPVGDKSAATQSADLILFDPLLIVRGLKVQWAQAKGMDTTVLVREYDDIREHQIGQNQGAPVLNLTRRANTGDRLLDGMANVPEVNFGMAH